MMMTGEEALRTLPPLGDTRATDAWLRAVDLVVTEATHRRVEGLAVAPDQARLFSLGLNDMRLAQAGEARTLTSAHLLVAILIDRGAPPEVILEVTTLATLIETGIDIIDNIADRELAPHWAAVPESAASLVGTLFVSGLPMALLADLPVPEARRLRMLATIGRRSTAIAHGQQEDYALSGAATVELGRLEMSYRRKTGDRHGLLLTLALEAAGVTDQAVLAAATAYAHELGLALQIRSDIGHLLGDEAMRDLRNGTRTWPVAFAMKTVGDDARAGLRALLQPETGCADALVDTLRTSGALVAATLRAERAAAAAREHISAFAYGAAAQAIVEIPTMRGSVTR
ncbi:MAG: polyprenyl synthetase family protein [Pseudomonadota bacterium]